MRKKSKIIMAGLVLAAALAACGNGGGTTTDKQNTQAEAEKNVEFSLGEISDKVYTNKMLGVKIDLTSSGMLMANEEEMQLFDEGIKDRSDVSEVKAFVDGGNVFIDMYAYSTTGTGTINIVLENMKKSGVDNIDKYIDAAIPQLEEEFKKSGFSDVKVEKSKVKLFGEEVTGINTVLSAENVTQAQKQAFIKCGDYLATITCAGENEMVADEVMNMVEKSE